MLTQLSPNRMSVPPPYGHYLNPHEHSSLVFVSKVLTSALSIAIAIALIALVPAKVMVPIAAVFASGVVVSLAVVGIDRRMSRRRPAHMDSTVERIELEPGEAAGLISFVLLLVAVFTPAGARALLTSAGLFGLGAFRFAAARSGWARRGAAWA